MKLGFLFSPILSFLLSILLIISISFSVTLFSTKLACAMEPVFVKDLGYVEMPFNPRRDDRREVARAFEVDASQGGGVIYVYDNPSPCQWEQLLQHLNESVRFWEKRIIWKKVRIVFQVPKQSHTYVSPFGNGSTIAVGASFGSCVYFDEALIHELAHVWGNQRGTSTNSWRAMGEQLTGNAHYYYSAWHAVSTLKQVSCALSLSAESQADVLSYFWQCSRTSERCYLSDSDRPILKRGAQEILEQRCLD
jgi:hypothetical protein